MRESTHFFKYLPRSIIRAYRTSVAAGKVLMPRPVGEKPHWGPKSELSRDLPCCNVSAKRKFAEECGRIVATSNRSPILMGMFLRIQFRIS
jgi:hypothetical protein